MTESSDADLLKGASARRRLIVSVAAALAGLAVGSDANGQSPRHPAHGISLSSFTTYANGEQK